MAITAKSIDAYLKRQGSPLAGLGSVFMAQGPRTAALLVAIAGAESSFGKVNSGSHNAWGWGPGRDFPSWQAAIQAIGKGLKTGYFAEGRTSIPSIGAKWAPQGASNDPTNLNSNWVTNVRKFYQGLTGGMPVGGSVSPPNATQPPSMGTITSSLGGLMLPSIGADYDPLKSLEELTMNVAAGATSELAPSGANPGATPGPVVLQAGGGWGGSKGMASSIIKGLGLSVTSEKRDRRNTSSGGVSDHWSGSKNAYAYDLGGSIPAMDNAAVNLARRLGIAYKKGKALVATVNRNGYRIQILYRTNVGGNHHDHIHVGVRRR